MTRVLALADRSSRSALMLLAALNLIFLLSFALMLMLATGRAHAEVACTGHDMLAELEQSDPALVARLKTQAAQTLNGSGLLWKVEKEGRQPSYVFGTMHMTDPRVTGLTPAAQTAFDASGTVVIETTDVLDQAAMMATLAQRPDLMMFTDNTTLRSLLTPEDAAIFDRVLQERGIPPASVAKMKPWMLSSMLAMPACELSRKAGGAPVLDVKLAQDAKAEGKQLAGLETAADQLEAMASLPMDLHVKGLIDTLKLGDRMDDIIETMIVLYTKGDTGMFWPLFRAVLPGGDEEASGYAEFEQRMVTERNKTMLRNAEPILAAGSAFIAVGALHLPGPEGLIELFRKAGYTVSPAG